MTHLPVAFSVAFLLEAALRALVAGAAVWAVLRLFRVRNVVAEKAVWCLLLAAALLLPFAPARMGLSAADVAGRIYALPQNAWASCLEKLAPHKATTAAALRQNASAPVAVPAAVPASAPQHPSVTARQKSASARRNAAATEFTAADDLPTPAAATTEIATETAVAPAAAIPPSPSPSLLLSQPSNRSTVPHPFRKLYREMGGMPTHSLRIGSITRWLPVAAGVLYLAIAALLLARLGFGLFAALRLWRSSQPLPVAGVSVRVSSRLSSPVTIGSCVLLPAGCTGWTTEKLRMVLAHESSHIRQGDFYLQMFAGLYAALAWPSPLGWWIKRRLCELGEAISDRAGLLEAPNPSSYAQLLLEFAALPRPTVPGVAMARSSRLSSRIESFLNESNFHLSFARSRRALLAVLVVPAALLLATSVVRVQAATPQQDQATVPAQSAAAQAQAPAADQQPLASPDDTGMSSEPGQPGMMLPPPPPPEASPDAGPQGGPRMPPPMAKGSAGPNMGWAHGGPGFGMNTFGESYAIVGDEKNNDGYGPRFGKHDIEKARKLAHGHFLWFERDGKSYFVDDPAVVAQLESADKNLEDLGRQMSEQGKQMREQSRQMREQSRKFAEQARQFREVASIKVPDLSKEMEDLNKSMATLKAKQGTTISQKELQEMERRLGEVQRKLGSAQFQMPPMPPMQFKQGDFGKNSEQMHQLGEQMHQLGEQMGKQSSEYDKKARSLIDESLKNGKAHPVE